MVLPASGHQGETTASGRPASVWMPSFSSTMWRSSYAKSLPSELLYTRIAIRPESQAAARALLIGEGGPFIEGGTRIALDGEVALNPDGGQLSAGRLHGYGFFHEAVTQLRGDAGKRQVVDAEVVAVSTGGGHPGGCVLLTRG